MASANEPVLFSIGEVAAIVGLSRHTIRAWERRHRLRPRRTASGQRRYTTDDVALLMHVKHAVTRHRLSLKVAFGAAQGDLSVPAVQESAAPGLWCSAVDLLPEMFLILDVDGFISAANRAASTTLGLPRDDLALLQRACVARTSFELELLAVSGRQAWEFDCRPFSSDGAAHLAVIGRPGGLRTSGQMS